MSIDMISLNCSAVLYGDRAVEELGSVYLTDDGEPFEHCEY